MSIPEGSHTIGPSNGSLRVKTGREGAASKAGHDLTLEVTSWEATVEGGDSPSIKLTADPTSIEVIEGTGGAKKLDDDDIQDIKKSTTDKVLGSSQITFESTEVSDSTVKGELTIAGNSSTVEAPLNVSDDKISGSITLKQSDFGIKKFSAMFGALKVADEVTVEYEGSL
ncbi:MAG TPA: YceI family protein [Solirubrobacteraceae bacterium]|nr:YceI family protein [Solirubrobacteraceae bacterium]